MKDGRFGSCRRQSPGNVNRKRTRSERDPQEGLNQLVTAVEEDGLSTKLDTYVLGGGRGVQVEYLGPQGDPVG